MKTSFQDLPADIQSTILYRSDKHNVSKKYYGSELVKYYKETEPITKDEIKKAVDSKAINIIVILDEYYLGERSMYYFNTKTRKFELRFDIIPNVAEDYKRFSSLNFADTKSFWIIDKEVPDMSLENLTRRVTATQKHIMIDNNAFLYKDVYLTCSAIISIITKRNICITCTRNLVIEEIFNTYTNIKYDIYKLSWLIMNIYDLEIQIDEVDKLSNFIRDGKYEINGGDDMVKNGQMNNYLYYMIIDYINEYYDNY